MAHILYIEDNPVNVQLIKRSLKSMGYRFSSASDAREGIALARREQPDLILLDMYLPDADNGLELATELRNCSLTWMIPIVAVTADHGLKHRALASGCDAYLEKPVSVVHLLRTVRQLLNIPERTDLLA